MSISRLLFSSSLLVCALLLGCSGDTRPNQKPTKPISVKVNYKGAPVEGATVTFKADTGTEAAYGRTDAQGVAKMKTYEEGDGAIMGKHLVSIAKSETEGGANAADTSSPDYVPPGENAPAPTVKHGVPQKYSNPKTSGLTAEVSASSPAEITFELTD